MTWPKFFDTKWFDRLFTVCLAVLVLLLTQGIISRREYNTRLKIQFDDRPTKTEVNSQVSSLQNYVDKQDDNIKNSLIQHIEEDKKSTENLKEWMRSIDGKLNIIINREK